MLHTLNTILSTTLQNSFRSAELPVVAASEQAAGDAGPCEGRGAGVVAHVVPLIGAHATALHVGPADAETRQTAYTRSVSETRVVEPSLCH